MTTVDTRRPSEVTDVYHIEANGPRFTLCWDQCGRWLLTPLDICDRDSEGNTELDRAWFGVKKLVEQGVLYDSLCSTAVLPDKNLKRGVITCYTPNCLKEIRRVADAIQEVVDCGLDIHFKKNRGTSINKCADKDDKNTVLYRHTPNGDLYVKEDDKWRLLIEDNGLECENIVSVDSSKRPSEVKDEDYIWALNIAASTCTDSSKAGKWILEFKDLTKDANGHTAADRAWNTVRDLVKKLQLPDSKCSTLGKYDNKADIVCYTADSTDMKEVWRVANTIRACVKYKANLYYYPSSNPSNGNCQDKHQSTALYKHTENSSLYMKDAGTWAEISADIVNPPKVCLSSSSERPSEVHHKSYIWALNKSGFPHVNNDKVGKWIIIFNDPSRNDDGATAADIAWAKVQKLVSKGLLHDSKCSTARINRSKFVIVCYTPDCTDVGKLWNEANTIRSRVTYEEDIYYKLDCAIYYGTNTEGQNTAIYRHTKYCDLYKNEAGIWTEITIDTMTTEDTRKPSEVTDVDHIKTKGPRSTMCWEHCGRWLLTPLDIRDRDSEGDTQLDRAWFGVKKLVEQGVLYNSVCSTALLPDKNLKRGVITCYTPNCLKEIRRVADAIREVVDYGLDIHFKKNRCTTNECADKDGKNTALYRHTPNGDLYVKDKDKWRLLIEDNGLECENIVSVDSSERPSEVNDEDYIWALNSASGTCTDSSTGGKWILEFKDLTKDANGATAADRAWSTVRDLVQKGQLPDSKCSTLGKHENKAVIVCYTADYTDVKEVWRVANTIRTWVKYKADLYYYLSSSPSNSNCQGTALYKHIENSSLYKKDAGTWAEISADIVNSPKVCLSSSSERPSEVHHKSYIWALNKDDFPHENSDKFGKWVIVFNDPSRNDEGATAGDIAWTKVQKLVNEGQLHDSKCSTAKLNRSTFVIVCYTPDYTDVKKLWYVANIIRSTVVYEEDIYYKLDCAVYYGEYTEGQNTAIYRHTKHCELCKNEAGIWTEISIQTLVNQGIERADTIRPSEVTSEMAVWAKRDDLPPYENDGKGGKWCIYLDKSVRDGQGDTVLDKAWYEIERLVREGSIYDSKCSTALCHPSATFCKGVIICYTPDQNDTADVKRVATAISTALKSVVPLDSFYYKSDDATRKGLYKIRGNDNITKYSFDSNTGVMSIKTGTVWENVDEHEIDRDIGKSVD